VDLVVEVKMVALDLLQPVHALRLLQHANVVVELRSDDPVLQCAQHIYLHLAVKHHSCRSAHEYRCETEILLATSFGICNPRHDIVKRNHDDDQQDQTHSFKMTRDTR
jgi:hypothetical protein